ncbi:MAG: metal ABC transporter ATP-binding protein [Patescibacteria group bacterium]
MSSSQHSTASCPTDILKVSDLSVAFGDLQVLRDVSFAVKEGEFAVIIGPNGAGKSVLIKTVLGLIPAKSGRVDLQVDNQDIGYVPQRLHFDPSFPLTVRELLLLKLPQAAFWWGRKTSEQRVKRMLELTKSSKVIDRQIGKLSGGELQRVLLAYALVNQPKLLILDEPAAGVDVVGEQTFYELIDLVRHTGVTKHIHGQAKPHQPEHVTVIMISHDLDAVYKYADNVICINRQLLCSGIPNKVLTPTVLAKAYGRHKDVFHHDHQYHQEHEHVG